jgi:hypothetical protein
VFLAVNQAAVKGRGSVWTARASRVKRAAALADVGGGALMGEFCGERRSPGPPAGRPFAGPVACLPDLLARLRATAICVIDAHVDDHGLCRICRTAFPCPLAGQAEFTLGAL